MIAAGLSAVALLAGSVAASPINVARELKEYTSDITIHESCNSTQRRMLEQALADTFEITTFAQEYIYKNGPQDAAFQKYFGNETSSYNAALGAYEALLTSNKEGVLLRCDDIDGNCVNPGWRGHWRGENGTSETVICDASYTDRVYNTAFCMYGYQLTQTAPSYYWALDLMHRFYHVPQVTNGQVDHYAHDLAEVYELAEHNATYSAHDSNALQYFAAHVYAIEVAGGGEGCIGEWDAAAHAHDHDATATSSAASAGSTTSSAPAECHTHADGAVHCADDQASETTTAAQECHTHADTGAVHCS